MTLPWAGPISVMNRPAMRCGRSLGSWWWTTWSIPSSGVSLLRRAPVSPKGGQTAFNFQPGGPVFFREIKLPTPDWANDGDYLSGGGPHDPKEAKKFWRRALGSSHCRLLRQKQRIVLSDGGRGGHLSPVWGSGAAPHYQEAGRTEGNQKPYRLRNPGAGLPAPERPQQQPGPF